MQALRNRASLPGLGSTRCSRNVEEAVAAHHQLGWAGLVTTRSVRFRGSRSVRNCYSGLLCSSNVFINRNEQKLG